MQIPCEDVKKEKRINSYQSAYSLSDLVSAGMKSRTTSGSGTVSCQAGAHTTSRVPKKQRLSHPSISPLRHDCLNEVSVRDQKMQEALLPREKTCSSETCWKEGWEDMESRNLESCWKPKDVSAWHESVLFSNLYFCQIKSRSSKNQLVPWVWPKFL